LIVQIQVAGASPAPRTDGETPHPADQSLEERASLLDAREQQLHEQAQDLEADRVVWYRRKEELEQECRQLQEQRDRTMLQSAQSAAPAANEPADVETERLRLAEAHKKLEARYRQRRDHLAGVHKALGQAAHKIKERKRQLDAKVQEVAQKQQAQDEQARQLDLRQKELDDKSRGFEEDWAQWTRRRQELEQECN